MKVDLLKMIGSVIGAVISLKLLFWIFPPAELITIFIVSLVIFLAYGIQNVEWPEESSYSIFGLNIYNSRRIQRQIRIFGIIPISSVITLETKSSFLGDLDPYILFPAKMGLSLLPFSAFLANAGKK